MKLLLSERELDIIKFQEYSRGRDECLKQIAEAEQKKAREEMERQLEKKSRFPKGCIPDNDIYKHGQDSMCFQCGKIGGHHVFEVCPSFKVTC